jgi:hypothetical protein
LKAGTPVTPTVVSGTRRSVQRSGVHSFSPFALSNVGAPLPVTLLSFTGKRSGSVNELKWVTVSEQNNRGFSVERSVDGRSYTTVGYVASRAPGGNSSGELAYAFSDNTATGSKWYYRLKQQDLDGRSKYSPVVALSADKSGLLTVDGVYPNPAKNILQVRVQAGTGSGNTILQLSDMQGRIVLVKSLSLEGGAATTATLDIQHLASGVYHLKAVSQGGEVSETTTVVKQ